MTLYIHYPKLLEDSEYGGSYIKPVIKVEAGVRIVCPGSPSEPRDGGKGSYVILKIDGTKIDVRFKKYK